MATHTLMTAEQFDQLPYDEERRLELIDGELIEMSSPNPEHQEVLTNLVAAVKPFMRQHSLGTVIADTDFAFGTDRLRPDLIILLAEKWAQVDRHKVPVRIIPDVVVEIISPSETASHLERKIAIYRKHGVVEVWVIHADQRHMYVHSTTGIRELHDTDTLACSLLPGWTVALAEVFG